MRTLLAQRYGALIIKGAPTQANVDDLRAKRVGIRLIRYEDATGLTSTEKDTANASGWMAKDVAGNLVQPVADSSRWLLDLTLPDARTWRADAVRADVVLRSFDGAYLDNLGAYFPSTFYTTPRIYHGTTPVTNTEWRDACVTFINLVKAQTGVEFVLVSGFGLTTGREYYEHKPDADLLIAAAHGVEIEDFTRDVADPALTFRSEGAWSQDMSLLQALGASSKQAFIRTGVSSAAGASTQDKVRLRDYALGSFLQTAKEDISYFSWQDETLTVDQQLPSDNGALAILGAPEGAPPLEVPVEPPLAGVTHRQDSVPPSTFLSLIKCGIAEANWADVQPTQGGPLVFTALDSLIQRARNNNGRVKLKVFCGVDSPPWAKTLDGTPLMLSDPPATSPLQEIPRFWTMNFRAAYEDLMGKLADRYDEDPTVATVQPGLAGTIFNEPFLRLATLQQNRTEYINKGFSIAQDKAALKFMLDVHAEHWPHTRLDLACHPYQRINSDASYGGPDNATTMEIMQYGRSVIGPHMAVGFTGLGKPPDAEEQEMYDNFQTLGKPIWWQTATYAKLGGKTGLQAALQEGINRGGNTAELPAGYQNDFTVAEMTPYNNGYKANAETSP